MKGTQCSRAWHMKGTGTAKQGRRHDGCVATKGQRKVEGSTQEERSRGAYPQAGCSQSSGFDGKPIEKNSSRRARPATSARRPERQRRGSPTGRESAAVAAHVVVQPKPDAKSGGTVKIDDCQCPRSQNQVKIKNSKHISWCKKRKVSRAMEPGMGKNTVSSFSLVRGVDGSGTAWQRGRAPPSGLHAPLVQTPRPRVPR